MKRYGLSGIFWILVGYAGFLIALLLIVLSYIGVFVVAS